eukprot:COSAG04_NODE_1147_length_8078_cov_1.968045_1_plen_469_part_10
MMLAMVLYRCVVKTKAKMDARLTGVRARYALTRKAARTAQRIQSEDFSEDYEGGTFQSLLESVKIIVSNLQIIAQFPITLKFTCGACTLLNKLLKFLPTLNFDMLKAVSFDCVTSIDLYGRFFFVVLSPIVLILAVQLRARMGPCCSTKVAVRSAEEKASAVTERHERIRDATQLSFVVIFLTYPAVTATIFTMFACRGLDQGQSFHVYDTSIDCNGAAYRTMYIITWIFLILMPVGIPVFFGFLLYKNREALMAGDSEEFIVSVGAFKKMVEIIRPEAIDADSSGGITLEELVQHALDSTLGKDQLEDGSGEPPVPNGSVVSFSEFRKMVEIIRPGVEFSDQALEGLFKAMDADSSGGITLERFVRYALGSQEQLSNLSQSDEVASTKPSDTRKAARTQPDAAPTSPKMLNPIRAGGGSAVQLFLRQAAQPDPTTSTTNATRRWQQVANKVRGGEFQEDAEEVDKDDD